MLRIGTMADDGMLLNFAAGNDDVQRVLPRFKGGSWRDRIRAERSVRHRDSPPRPFQPRQQTQPDLKPQDQVEGESRESDDFPEPRAIKKRREHGEFSPKQSRDTPIESVDWRPQQRTPSRKPREVISSLFSYNPASTSLREQAPAAADEVDPKPSNAPLPDAIEPFTSLGLSYTLSAHLMTKMVLKSPTAIQSMAIKQLLKEDCDAFLQSETGSGKTLAYLLPIVQRIMALSRQGLSENESSIQPALHRDSGLFAIILAPTRELCKQISVALERLLGCANYVVAGNVLGGEKKKSEKARLRKGLNILVATPGRLVDHLDNTKVLDVSSVRWLVMDEGDRLMELGFEHDISRIVQALDERQRPNATVQLPKRRSTILCSATMKTNVRRLGEVSLNDAILIKPESEQSPAPEAANRLQQSSAFLAPAQLKQSFVIVPAKLRFVALTALIRRSFSRKGSIMKSIVFFSCADSVDFHFNAFAREEGDAAHKLDSKTLPVEPGAVSQFTTTLADAINTSIEAPLLSASASQDDQPLTIYKLHGSLPQQIRTATMRSFSQSTAPSLLLSTDVASRGLDLPNLDLVIEYDPAFSAEDHLHRIGRTARLGRDGRATIFLLPGAEEGYVDGVLRRSFRATEEGVSGNVTQMPLEDVLKKGFMPVSGVVNKTSEGSAKYEQRATDFQLDMERWVLTTAELKRRSQRAFQSHVRAYATHVAAERKWFDIKELHLGHLAKAFGLRDAPGNINGRSNSVRKLGGADSQLNRGRGSAMHAREEAGATNGTNFENLVRDDDVQSRSHRTTEAAQKMRAKVKMMWKGSAAVDEFNIA